MTLGASAVSIKPGPNLAIFTATPYSRIDVQTTKARPVLADVASASAQQLREVWGPLVAGAGTYDLTGNLMIAAGVAKNQAAMAPDVQIVYSS